MTSDATRNRVQELLGDPDTREDGIEMLATSGVRHPAAIAVRYASDSDPLVRAAVLELLKSQGSKRHAEQVASMLTDESDVVRISAIECLVEWRTRKYARHVAAALDDESPLVRAYAAWAVGRLRMKNLVDRLQHRLRDERDHTARAGLLEALVSLTGKEEYFDELAGLLDSPDYQSRCFVANSLVGAAGTVGNERTRAVLEDALSRESTLAVKEAIADNLAMLAS